MTPLHLASVSFKFTPWEILSYRKSKFGISLYVAGFIAMTEKQFMNRKVQFKFKMTIDAKKAKIPEKAPLFMFAMFLKATISILLK